MRYSYFIIGICFGFFLTIAGCGEKEVKLDTIVVRIADDPDRLNPVIARSSIALQITNKLFQPLAEFDPETLLLRPVLMDTLPEAIQIDTGQYAGFYGVPVRIRDEAAWRNGSPITVSDIEFTFKCILLCEWYESGVPGLFNNVVAIERTDNEKQFNIIVKDNSIFSIYSQLLLPIMPEYFYDKNGMTLSMSFNEALNEGSPKWLESEPSLKTFVERFNSMPYSRHEVNGSGPYRFRSWSGGQLLTIDLKKNYWGDATGIDYLSSQMSPSVLAYRIIPDEQSAIESLKEGSVDIVGDFSPDQFARLQKEEDETIALYSPDVLQYYFIGINHKHEVLEDRAVRQALAYLLPIDDIIAELFNNLASPLAGPVHPAKPYYNEDLTPYPYDPEKALEILTDAGWADSDENGILDKTLENGEQIELSLEITTSQRPLGQSLSLILQDEAKAIGVDISIDVVDNPTLLQKVTERTFHLANLASRFNPGYDEVYSGWHSNSIDKGNNIIGFSHPEVDSLVELIHSNNVSQEELFGWYREFQAILHEEVPVLFICAPNERVAAKASISLPTTAIKPGYLEHLARGKK